MNTTTAFAALSFDFAAASMAQIVAFHNELVADCGVAAGAKAVARFSDRKTAVARTEKLLVARNAMAARLAADAAHTAPQAAAYARGTCPKCGGTADITCGRVLDRKSGQVVVDEHIAFHHSCGHEFNYETGAPIRRASAAKDPAARAAKIAASWADAAVASARKARHSVTFTTDDSGARTYRSVCAAFEALGLPMGKHIAFRAELKAAGTLETFGGVWVARAA